MTHCQKKHRIECSILTVLHEIGSCLVSTAGQAVLGFGPHTLGCGTPYPSLPQAIPLVNHLLVALEAQAIYQIFLLLRLVYDT